LAAAASHQDPQVGLGWSKYVRPPGGAWNEETYKGIAYGAIAWATYVADVEIDLTTFEVTLRDFVASQEIGKVLNPVLAAGQIQGGVVQALGWALLEDTILNEQGAMANNNMTTYVVPTSADVPLIRVIFLEQPYGYGPFGAKGIGELPMDGPAPAVVNAVVDALGVEVDDLPCSPERLMGLLMPVAGEEVAA
jgi:CO/xanthine dehydrogenase Mo-binding subunit